MTLPTGAPRKRSTRPAEYGKRYGKWTPGDAAKGYARQHPNENGILEVLSHAPKGKGGWGVAKKRTRFVFIRGEAAPLRSFRLPPGTPGHDRAYNGQCQVCGSLHLGGSLRLAYDDTGCFVYACRQCVLIFPLSYSYLNRQPGRSRFHKYHGEPAAVIDIRATQFKHDEPPVIVSVKALEGGAP